MCIDVVTIYSSSHIYTFICILYVCILINKIMLRNCLSMPLLGVGIDASRNHLFFSFFLSPDFHGLWYSVLSICLSTEIKQQYDSTWMGDHFSTLLRSLKALRLTTPKPILALVFFIWHYMKSIPIILCHL